MVRIQDDVLDSLSFERKDARGLLTLLVYEGNKAGVRMVSVYIALAGMALELRSVFIMQKYRLSMIVQLILLYIYNVTEICLAMHGDC